jgi:hypothetical protein
VTATFPEHQSSTAPRNLLSPLLLDFSSSGESRYWVLRTLAAHVSTVAFAMRQFSESTAGRCSRDWLPMAGLRSAQSTQDACRTALTALTSNLPSKSNFAIRSPLGFAPINPSVASDGELKLSLVPESASWMVVSFHFRFHPQSKSVPHIRQLDD